MKTTDFRATNLRATDLMIGDWVKLSKGNWSKNRQVGLTDIEMIAESVYLAEPIPLTPEILEKNGFVSDFEGDMFWESESTYFALQKGVDGRNRWWWEVCNSPLLPLNYVHELQHALKLCGIEKEITL